MHLVLPTAHSKRGRQLTAIFSGILLTITVVLGVKGLWGPTAPGCVPADHDFTDRVYRFFLLLGFGGEGLKLRECFSDPVLEVARYTGPLGIVAGFLALLWGLLEDAVAWMRLRLIARHAVVVGLGQRGRTLTRHAARSRRVVAIDVASPDGALPQRCESVHGDGREARTLRKARIDKAQYVFATTGDDLLNLQIARQARDLGCERVYALVNDDFARRVADDARFAAINAVSLEDIAARSLTAEARFHELAELQAHAQLHLVVFGDGALAGAVIAQAVRTALTSALGTPVVSVLAAFPEQARKAFLRSYPGLESACALEVFEFDPECDVLDQPTLFSQISARAPVSAIVVADTETHRACLFAGALEGALRRAAAWPAPIFFSAEPLEVAEPFARRLGEVHRLSDVLHPFETGARLCTPENVAAIDETARRLHDSYLAAHRKLSAAGGSPSAAAGALVEWSKLAPTFRQANRRAADHIPGKLLSAGCFVPPGPPRLASGLDLLGDGRLERLAELEHRAWMADRLLAGWRPGPTRNERARLHECLVPYGQLPEATKELDRAQVRDLVAGLPADGSATSPEDGLVRFDLWFGIIGSLDVEEGDVEWLGEAAAAQLDALMAAAPGRHITFVSPLAPGSDLILTRRLMARAAERSWPHRLIVPEALPPAAMVADFEDRWRDGALGDVGAHATTWPEVARTLLAARAQVIDAAPDGRVIEASVASEGDHQQAYRWQNVYLIRRCDVLLAALRTRAGRAAGGTAEALRWRTDRSLVPAAFAEIAPRVSDEPQRTIVLNLKTREVS